MSKEISRRQFLENIGLGTAAGTSLLLLKDVANARPTTDAIPSRTLGRTGAKVSILAFGCGSRFLMYKDEDSASDPQSRDRSRHHLSRHGLRLRRWRERNSRRQSHGDAPQRCLAGNENSRPHSRRIPAPAGSQSEAPADRSCRSRPHPQPRPGRRPRENRSSRRRPQRPDGSPRAKNGAVCRHDQPHQRRGDGHGDQAPRPRLRADGAQRLAQRPLRRTGATRGQCQEPRRDRHEGDRAGILGGRRSGQGRHELAAALFDEPAGDDRGRGNAAPGDARPQRRDPRETFQRSTIRRRNTCVSNSTPLEMDSRSGWSAIWMVRQ